MKGSLKIIKFKGLSEVDVFKFLHLICSLPKLGGVVLGRGRAVLCCKQAPRAIWGWIGGAFEGSQPSPPARGDWLLGSGFDYFFFLIKEILFFSRIIK